MSTLPSPKALPYLLLVALGALAASSDRRASR
jgi:hypothetical protein